MTKKRWSLLALILVLSLAIPLTVYFIASRPRPFTPLIRPEAKRISFGRLSFDRSFFAMESSSNVVLSVRTSNDVFAIKINAETGLRETNAALSQFLREGIAPGHSGPLWRISSKGDKLISTCFSNELVRFIGYDLKQNQVSFESDESFPDRFFDLFWLQSSDTWLALAGEQDAFEAVSGRQGLVTVRLTIPTVARDFRIVGFDATTNMIMLTEKGIDAEPSRDAEIIKQSVSGPLPILVTNKISLPFDCKVLSLEASPSGKLLLWSLEEPPISDRTLTVSSQFPFVSIQRTWHNGLTSLWISSADGSLFKCLGQLKGSKLFAVYNLQWCPGEETIAVRIVNDLYFIPVPSDFRESAGPAKPDSNH